MRLAAIDEISWGSMTGCGSANTASIPLLFRKTMEDEQIALWGFEQLAMIAENQGSVVEITAPLVPVFEHLATTAARESVRRSAQQLLSDLASSVYSPPWGAITEQEVSERQAHVTDVVTASTEACERLPDLGQPSTQAVADYSWLEQERATLLAML